MLSMGKVGEAAIWERWFCRTGEWKAEESGKEAARELAESVRERWRWEMRPAWNMS